MYKRSIIQRKHLHGGPGISRNVEREYARQRPLQAANKVSVLTPSSHYVPNPVVDSKFTLYEVGVPIAGMLSDASIVERAVGNAANRKYTEEPPKVATMAETTKTMHLLPNRIECSGGDQTLMRCIEQLESAILGPDANAKQAGITLFFLPQ